MELLGDILRRLAPNLDLTRTAQQTHEDINRTRADAWKAACAAGRCRYAKAPRFANQEPDSVDSRTTCGGYVGVRYVQVETEAHDWLEQAADDTSDPAKVFWRWRPCSRQVAWAAALGALKRKERETFADSKRKTSQEPATPAWKKDQGSD